MAVDHSSVPKDLRPSASPGRAHAPPPWAPIDPSPGGPLFSSSAAVAAADDHLSSRKVKLLCSFGGRILPRPSDGTLRYAGGHTRIISLRKDVSFAEFVSKMAEAVGAATVAVKYQLPGEDLDALISVSCPEDLVNLMEEYDKLSAASTDGSFKLRAFLFSPSELSSADFSLHHGAVDDVDQRYVEALNGFSVSDGSRGLRSNSFTSAASSTQNSEGTAGGDAMEDGMGEGMSPSFPSPAADSPHDAPRLVYVGGNNPTMASDAAIGIPGGTLLPPGMSFAAQNPTLGRPDMPPMAPYMAPSFVDPHQLHYVTPQHLGQHLGIVGGLQQINVAPLTMHSYVPSGVPSPTNMPPIASQIDNLQPIQARLVPNMENPYGGKGLQSLSQLPPLPPSFTPLPHAQPQARLEDCLMCQKALPHAHSDTLVQEHGIGTPDSFRETTSMFYSQRSVPLGTGALVNNFPGLNVENMNTASQLAGSLFPHIPDVQHVNTRPTVQRPDEENSSNQRLLVDNYMQQILVNPLQLQQHQVSETLQPPPYLMKQEMVTGLPNEESLLLQQLQTGQLPNCMVKQEGVMDLSDAGVYANYHSTQPTTQGYAHQFTDEKVELVERRMEALWLGPPGAFETTHQGKPATTHLDAPSYLVAENSNNVGPQFGDTALFIGDAGGNYRYVVPDGNYSKPIEQVPLRSSEVIQLQRLQNEQNANMIKHHDPFPYNLGISEYAGHVNTLENIKPVAHENMMPPRPSRMVSKESASPNRRAVGSDIVSMLEEGSFHHPPDTMSKDLCFEPVRLAKATEEENIKQQLQAVAEDVAASVFQPPASSAPETKNLAPEINNEMRGTPEGKELDKIVPDEEIEDSMAKQLIQENQGIHLTEDMGRLQIIKNSDLEELQELGSGTFGTVYHGKWRGTDVAIKRINDRCFAGKKSEEERMRADFWNEACKLADLHHPNVVAFYGVALDGPDGSIATITEYMVNGSLRQALQRNHKAFDRRQRFLIAMDVAFGMEYLHAKSIVHFDLKSDNLLVNLRDPHRPICKVGDLGLSKVKCRTLISGGMRGTLPWMAPELLYGNDSLVSEKVDVFSFGIVMWEIMTGEEPYADLHYGAIIGGILSNTLRPPVPESCDPEWRTLMEQCWSAEPLERPSFTEIANRLRCMASALSQKAQQHQAAHK